MDIDETNATLMIDRADLRSGKALFINNCAVCHTENGSGAVGPNLTDNYWIYSNDIKEIFKVIKKGTSNGMPEHQSKFNPIEIQQVASYVLNLEEVTQEQGGKEPEGEIMMSDDLEGSTEEKLDTLQREELKDSISVEESIE
jgi:cytochrome c oxidase cbb3-type subunit 3